MLGDVFKDFNGAGQGLGPVMGRTSQSATRLIKQIYTSFEEVADAYNQARYDLIELGLLWRGSKLDNVQCLYERGRCQGSSPASPRFAKSGKPSAKSSSASRR